MASVRKRKWTSPAGERKEAWEVRYLDSATQRHPAKTFKLKKDADAYARKVEREIEDGAHIARRETRTVAQLVDEYLDHLDRRADEQQLSKAHAEAMRRALAYAREDMGGILLTALTWQQVEQHGRGLRKRTSKYFGRRLAAGTINGSLSALSRCISFGVRRGYAIRNVVPDARAELGSLPCARIATFSQDDMKRILTAIEDRPAGIAYRSQAMMRAVVYLGAMCGLRRGEIFGLRWSSIDLDRRLLAVDRSLTNRDVLKSPKTEAGLRVVPLPSLVAAALDEWRRYAIEDARGLIFRTATAGQVTDNSFYKSFWHPILRRAGFDGQRGDHRHFHATRHFAGSAWLDAGVPLPEVSRLMGHANVSVTAKIYSHAITEVHHRASILDQCAALIARRGDAADTQQLRIAA